MRINNKIWISIIIFCIVIIGIKYFSNFNFEKNYSFSRKLLDELQIEKIENNKIPQILDKGIITNKLICNFKTEDFNSQESLCKMTYFDVNDFRKLSEFDFKIPKSAQITYCNKEYVLYIYKFNIYCYSIKNSKTNKILLTGLNAYSAILLDNSPNILIFGEQKIEGNYQTGFFTLDTTNSNLNESKIIENNDKSMLLENLLIYSGKFSINDLSSVSYFCDKNSKILFFNAKGNYIKDFTTNDKTLNAKLVSNNKATYYKRGETFNTNSGVLKKGDIVSVFSSRTADDSKIIMMDQYLFSTGEYIYSNSLSNKNYTSADINYVTYSNQNLLISFDSEINLFQYFHQNTMN